MLLFTGNARYAKELALASGVDLRVIVRDVLSLLEPHQPERTPEGEVDGRGDNLEGSLPPMRGAYDAVLMEQGILHYFVDLEPLFRTVAALARPAGGRLILRDFHPGPVSVRE